MSEFLDALKLKGDVTITKTNAAGITESITYPNLVVTVGKQFICNRMSANTINVMSVMGVGTGTTAAAAADTALESNLANVALTVTGGTPSSNTLTFAATFPAGTGTGAITEAAVFNGQPQTNPTMLCRTVFPVVNKGASDVVGISWVINII